jgi:hypothetical protein
VVLLPRPLKLSEMNSVWAVVLRINEAEPVAAEPVGGTSLEPTRFAVKVKFAACIAGDKKRK